MSRDPRRSKPPNKGLAVGIVIGVVVLIVIIVVVVILIRRKKTTATTTKTSVSSKTCTSNANCPAPSVCNTSSGLCVDCLGDSNCSGSTPKCKTSLNKCVTCLADGDCTTGQTCNNNVCCSTTKPVITSVSSILSDNTRIDVNFTFSQGLTATQAIVVMEDPASGLPLFNSNLCIERPSVTCTATPNCQTGDVCNSGSCNIVGCLSTDLHTAAQSMTVSIYENQFAIHFYPGASYRIKLKIVYTCGSLTATSTAFSDPVTHVIGNCGSLAPQTIGLSYINGGTDLLLTFPDQGTPSYQVLVVATPAPGLHPSYGVVAGPFNTLNGGTAYIEVPNPFSFNPLYVRARRYGGTGNCSGPLGNENQVTL